MSTSVNSMHSSSNKWSREAPWRDIELWLQRCWKTGWPWPLRNCGVLLLCAVALLTGCGESKPKPVELATECNLPWLLDDEGRVVIARGINISAGAKWSQHRVPDLSREELRRLREDFGLNTIRLLVFWEAIEPLPGRYDHTYLDTVAAFAKDAADEGFLLVVDMHQDLFGRGFGQAGAPRWACLESYYESFEPPQDWWMGYLKPEVALCFDRLYTHAETRGALGAAWFELASALRGIKGIWGYDLLNEPFWGSTSASTFDSQIAPELYRELIDIIRSADPNPWIGIEPAPTANLGVSSTMQSTGRGRTVYMPHFYPKQVEVDGRYTGNRSDLSAHLQTLCKDAKRLQLPLLVGEFGVRGKTRAAAGYIRDFYHVSDEALIGTMFWHYGEDGQVGYGLLDTRKDASEHGIEVARPALSRIRGVPKGVGWYPDEDLFIAEWDESADFGSPTLVSLPQLAVGSDYDITLSPPGDYTRTETGLEVRPIGAQRRLVIQIHELPELAPASEQENKVVPSL